MPHSSPLGCSARLPCFLVSGYPSVPSCLLGLGLQRKGEG